MRGRPPKDVYNLIRGNYVKVRLNPMEDWDRGYVTLIDPNRQQIFVDVDGNEYQFSFNEYNKLIIKE